MYENDHEKKLTSRERLLLTAHRLFATRGYHNTSIADLAEACHLRKASIYHHITSKIELGLAVLQNANNHLSKVLLTPALNSQISESTRLTQFAQTLLTECAHIRGGCLMGSLALEIVDTVPEFVPHIKTYFDAWINTVTQLLTKQYGETKARQFATEHLGLCQGSLILCRLYKTDAPLAQACQRLAGLLTTTTASSDVAVPV